MSCLGYVQAAYYDATVVLADQNFTYDDEERQEIYTKIDIMEGELKSTIETEELLGVDEEDDGGAQYPRMACVLPGLHGAHELMDIIATQRCLLLRAGMQCISGIKFLALIG